MKANVELELRHTGKSNELEVSKTFRHKTNCEIPVESIYNHTAVSAITIRIPKFVSSELMDFLYSCLLSKDELNEVRNTGRLDGKDFACQLIINNATINECVLANIKHLSVGVELVLWMTFKGGCNG